MQSLAQILKDPPPSHAFEISEAGLSAGKIGAPGEIHFVPFPEGVIAVSPVHDNVQQPDMLAERIEALAPANGSRKRRAALILPDYAARVAVLDFDAFPVSPEEQRSLVRFRMKKSVPFDVDNAMVSFLAQPRAGQKAKFEVLVAVMASEIVLRYEEPFRKAGFLPGFVTTSALAMLNLIAPDGVTLIVKLNGHTLTVVILDGSAVKLVRCVQIHAVAREDIESVVLPTLAYIEDELSKAPKRILLCGLGGLGDSLSRSWASDWGVAIETPQSRYGAPGPLNAGLFGYLELIG